jgi:translocation and assembly module TamB
LRAPSVSVEASAPGLAVGGLHFTRAQGDARLDGGTLAVRLDAAQADGGTLRLAAARTASAALSGSASIDRFDLAFLPRLVPALREASGRVTAQLALGGTTAAPDVTGTLALDGGVIVVREVGQRIEDVTLRARLAPGEIIVDRLAARAGRGTTEATGTLGYTGLTPTRLVADLRAKDFRVALPGATSARLDGSVHVEAQRPDAQRGLAGTVTVKDGVLDLPGLPAGGKKLQPLGPLEDVVFVDAAGRRARARARAARRGAFPVELDVVVPGTFGLRGKEINADVRGALRVRSGGGALRLDGTLEALGGWLDLVGQRFTIDHVRIAFTGESPPDPTLDIRITRVVEDTTVAVEVSGRLHHPELRFSSDPPRFSSSEVVSLLLTGRTGSQGVSESSLDQKVVGALSSLVIGRLKSELLPSLPIDVLKVEVGPQGGPASTVGSRIEVGKYVTTDVYVSYVHQTGQPNALYPINNNQVNIEWRFARRFEIDVLYGDAGVGGADFVFRWRF